MQVLMKEERMKIKEKCPDLNLDLRISPPSQQQHNYHDQPFKTGGRENTIINLCFACSIGVQNSKDCSCNNNNNNNNNGINSNSGYDFLGLKSGVLDYRSLEMK